MLHCIIQLDCIRRYEILQCGNLEKLIKKRKNPEESPMYYLSIEDTYDVIRRHLSTGHGGRDRMLREVQKICKRHS